MNRTERSIVAHLEHLGVPEGWKVVTSDDPRVRVDPGVGLVSDRWNGGILVKPWAPTEVSLSESGRGPCAEWSVKARLPRGARLEYAAEVALWLARVAAEAARVAEGKPNAVSWRKDETVAQFVLRFGAFARHSPAEGWVFDTNEDAAKRRPGA